MLELGDELASLAVEATGIALWAWDATTSEVRWSARMHELTGVDVPLLPHEYVRRVVHPGDRARVEQAVRNLMAGGPERYEPHRIVRPGGEIRRVLCRGRVKRSKRGEIVGVVGGVLDVTAHFELELRLEQVERVESMGSLTLAVAHNFGNLTEMLRSALCLLEPHVAGTGRDVFDQALAVTQSAVGLVGRLSSFATSRHARRPAVIEVAPLLQAVVCGFRTKPGIDVELCVVPSQRTATVRCDPMDLEQVVINLLINACDASGPSRSHSRVIVSLESAPASEPGLLSQGVQVSVDDAGRGVPPELRRRVFEPFFTTKRGGTGLGLSLSSAMVRAGDGRIYCEDSRLGGARFRIVLPRLSPEGTAPPSRPDR